MTKLLTTALAAALAAPSAFAAMAGGCDCCTAYASADACCRILCGLTLTSSSGGGGGLCLGAFTVCGCPTITIDSCGNVSAVNACPFTQQGNCPSVPTITVGGDPHSKVCLTACSQIDGATFTLADCVKNGVQQWSSTGGHNGTYQFPLAGCVTFSKQPCPGQVCGTITLCANYCGLE
jgi:hypothetical protein